MTLTQLRRPRGKVLAGATAGILVAAMTPFAVGYASGGGRTPTAAPGTTLVADSYVKKGTPASTRGSRDFFRAGEGYTAYLKFEVATPTTGNVRLNLWSRVETGATLRAHAVKSTNWREKKLAASNAPRVGAVLGTTTGLVDEGWVSVDVSQLVTGPGTYTVALKAADGRRAKFSSRHTGRSPRLTFHGDPVPSARPSTSASLTSTPSTPASPTASASSTAPKPTTSPAATPTRPAGTPVTVAVVGDIVKTEKSARGTAQVIRDMNPKYLLTVGDNAYADGSAADYRKYDAVYGQFKSITRPVPGNHEYHTRGAKGYFDYFDKQVGGKPYYAFDAGAWRVYALNSEISMKAGSPQEKWLRADLAANRGKRILATIHKPRYTCSTRHAPNADTNALYTALLDFGGDILLAGHNHAYERFAPMDNAWKPKADGIRSWVVGTGGASLYDLESSCSHRDYRQDTDKGVLKLVLGADSYSWEFIAVGGKVMDSGTHRM